MIKTCFVITFVFKWNVLSVLHNKSFDIPWSWKQFHITLFSCPTSQISLFDEKAIKIESWRHDEKKILYCQESMGLWAYYMTPWQYIYLPFLAILGNSSSLWIYLPLGGCDTEGNGFFFLGRTDQEIDFKK